MAFDNSYPRGFMTGWKNLFEKLIGALPLKKLTPNQTFDLASDIVMIIFVVSTLAIVDLGRYGDVLRPVMVAYTVLFIAWSTMVNR